MPCLSPTYLGSRVNIWVEEPWQQRNNGSLSLRFSFPRVGSTEGRWGVFGTEVERASPQLPLHLPNTSLHLTFGSGGVRTPLSDSQAVSCCLLGKAAASVATCFLSSHFCAVLDPWLPQKLPHLDSLKWIKLPAGDPRL